MRVSCPHCKRRFDVGHLAVLSEHKRLAERAKAGRPAAAVNGNVLDPSDGAAAEERAEAIRRRTAKEN